ncbi:hypothetical protein ABTX71_12755 [Streptomyces parvulus]|uniref:hypothetical protein n=1 Tax=Streptomyces parvulus TaxID=146923 RepID=UPI00332D8AA6
MAASSQIPQLGPATALVQLLTENPTLPALSWRISASEFSADTLHGSAPHTEDPRPVAAAWAAALGAEVSKKPFLYDGDVEYVEFAVVTVWRDVPVQIYTSCPVSLLTAKSAVAA